MHNLSMTQALDLWSDLEAAYYGKNGYGGDVAEIYAYRLMPRSPMTERVEGLDLDRLDKSTITGRAIYQVYRDAAQSLRALILFFEKKHEKCKVMLNTDQGLISAAGWLSDNAFAHRIHVQVVHDQPKV